MMNTEIIGKYFSGELMPDQKREFFLMLENDAQLKQEFFDMQNLVGMSAMSRRATDEKLGRRKFNEFESKMKRQKLRRNVLSISRYAAILVVAVVTSWVLAKQHIKSSMEGAYAEIEVPQGNRAQVKLDDGTVVWLNSRTKLRYPTSFAGDKRVVILDGEGYFSVAKDKKRPFVVRTSRYDVEVLGTKFNVFNYSECPVFETTLLEGEVSVYKENDKQAEVILKPNEQVVMSGSMLVRREIEKQDISMWEGSNYMFDDMQFEAILRKLELYYNVRFVVRNERALESTYTGTFSMGDKLTDILNAMHNVQKFSYSMSSDSKIVYID